MLNLSRLHLLLAAVLTTALLSCAYPSKEKFLHECLDANSPLEVKHIVDVDRLLDFEGTVRVVLQVKAGDKTGDIALLILGSRIEVRSGGVDEVSRDLVKLTANDAATQKIAKALSKARISGEQGQVNARLLIEELLGMRKVGISEWKLSWMKP